MIPSTGPFPRVNYACPDAQNLGGGESFVWKAGCILEKHEDVPELHHRWRPQLPVTLRAPPLPQKKIWH